LHAVNSASSAPAVPSAAIVIAICAAEILGLAGFSTVPALLPQFIETWSLTNTQAGWLAGIMSAGYMLAVVPLVSLTDRQPARHIYLASSALSALSCFGIALCDSLLPALAFRAAAGIALAGMYMPGLQALTAGADGTIRARIAAWYTTSFTIGASLSFLLGGIGTLWGGEALLFSPESSVPPVSSSRGLHCRGRIQESPNSRARSSTSDRFSAIAMPSS
jgi:MFS family permease